MLLPLAFALQVGVRIGTETRSDSARQARRDSIRAEIQDRRAGRERRPPRRIPLTPELERSAFLDPRARELLLRARATRMRQDSTLRSYDATEYERLSVGLGFRAIGRDRLLFRTENASRVQWSRDGGAWVEVKGRRSVFPMFKQGDADMDLSDDVPPLPYYPGREALWIGPATTRAEVDDRELVHPLALGSEAYYRYASGDSLSFTLPDKRVIRLQELRVEPRRPEWRLSVGSFWFDQETGQLVRAVYRLAVPIDIWTVADEESRREQDEAKAQGRPQSHDDDVPGWVKAFMSPLAANLEAVTIEYGLFGTRFWLPRTQYAEGWAKAGFMRIPFKIEQSFKYADVNGDIGRPPVPLPPKPIRDSLFAGDSTPLSALSPEERRRRARAVSQARAERRKQEQAAAAEECARTGLRTTLRDRYEGAVRVAVQVPCDTTKLATAPELPPSIYDPGEELFGVHDREELLKALDFSLQAGWAPQRPEWQYGFGLTRYNRVEGLSTGLGVTMQLGQGYTIDGLARIGTGDWAPNAELGASRSNGRVTWRLGAYRRLAVASDWGSPLSFGSGLAALLFGRDDGFYYRALGVSLERSSARGAGLSTRFFAEYQSPASVTTQFNLARALGTATRFRDNVDAIPGDALGVAIRDLRSAGLDPAGWRAFSDVRLEAGWFDPRRAADGDAHVFSRAAGDFTLSRGLGHRLATSLTVGAGVAEHAPIQRAFFLGGTETVRGQLPGTDVGDAYWMSRLEIGSNTPGARRVIFGDLGWAGPRGQWQHPGRPMSGAGVGASFLDGLIRADLARGIYPRKKFRFDLYLDARF